MKFEPFSIKLFLLFLIIAGFFYQIYGLSANYSFWTDEDHVAIFAGTGLDNCPHKITHQD